MDTDRKSGPTVEERHPSLLFLVAVSASISREMKRPFLSPKK